MKKQVFLIIVLIVIIFPVSSCIDSWTDIRDAPYRYQLQNNYCAVACIQMWAIFDGADEFEITQDFIADHINFGYYGNGVIPDDIRDGVEMFTDSFGYVAQELPTNLGQDECIAACIASIKDFRLAIVPFFKGLHAVLAFGYKWHYENGMRIADKMYYHDPNPLVGPNRVLPAYDLKIAYFKPINDPPCYWSVVARRRNRTDGIDGYNIFISEGGTFYGGPSVYDPLSFNPLNPIN
jgi:hypothetical protein